MPDDAAGNASRPPSPIPVSGQGADAPQVNVPIDDIYACLNRRHFSDGRKPFGGDQNLNGYQIKNAKNATDAQDYITLSQMQDAIAAVSGFFPGILIPDTINSATAPAGWVFANGQSLLRATYPALWARVSSGNNLAASQSEKTAGQYGPGDGSTTFTVPNLYADGGYFIRPLTSGRGIGTVQADETRSHTHNPTINDPGHLHSALGWTISAGGIAPGAAIGYYETISTSPATTGISVSIGSSGGLETRPKNIAYPVLIKT